MKESTREKIVDNASKIERITGVIGSAAALVISLVGIFAGGKKD